jgi:hypothetical protein
VDFGLFIFFSFIFLVQGLTKKSDKAMFENVTFVILFFIGDFYLFILTGK